MSVHHHDHAHTRRSIDPREILQGIGLRVTGVRVQVLDVLRDSEQAITAQQVFDAVLGRLPAKSGDKPDRVTVYRTLNTLVESGVVHKLDPGDRVFRFRLTDHAQCTDDKHDHEHPHFVCDACGTVECLEGATVQITPAPKPVSAIESRSEGSSGRSVRQDVVLHGTCGPCSTTETPVKTSEPAPKAKPKQRPNARTAPKSGKRGREV